MRWARRQMAAYPLDVMMRMLPVPVSLPIAHGSFTVDAVNALEDDYVVSGQHPGFKVNPVVERSGLGLRATGASQHSKHLLDCLPLSSHGSGGYRGG